MVVFLQVFLHFEGSNPLKNRNWIPYYRSQLNLISSLKFIKTLTFEQHLIGLHLK